MVGGSCGVFGGQWEVLGGENQKIMSPSEHQPKMMLAINISPSDSVSPQPTMHTSERGCRMGWRLAVGQVADDAVMEGR